MRLAGSLREGVHRIGTAAHDAFLLALRCLSRDELDEAVSSFEQAIQLDPKYAAAYDGIAAIHIDYIWSDRGSPDEKLPLVEDLVNKALHLDDSQINALSIRAANRFFVNHDYQNGIDRFDELLKRFPSSWYPMMMYFHVLKAIGRFDLCIAVADRMVELDPINPWLHLIRFLGLIAAGNYEAALRSLDLAEEFGYRVPFHRAAMALLVGDKEGILLQVGQITEGLGYDKRRAEGESTGIPYIERSNA